MAKKIPVRVCRIRQVPNKDPKFHQAEMFEGLGRSMSELLMIFVSGWVFRRFMIIGFIIVENNGGFSNHRSRLKPE